MELATNLEWEKSNLSNSSTDMASTVQNQMPTTTKVRKAYHKPSMESYGAVSELTRSNVPNPLLFDIQLGYNASV